MNLSENVNNYLDKHKLLTSESSEKLLEELDELWKKCSLEEVNQIERIIQLRDRFKERLKEKEIERETKYINTPAHQYDDGMKALEEADQW